MSAPGPRRIAGALYRRFVAAVVAPAIVGAVRALLTLLFRRLRRPDLVGALSLETVLGTREAVPLILALSDALTRDGGRMTAAQNTAVFREQIEPVFLKYCASRRARILEVGPGLLNPFAFPFLFFLHGHCERYFGVDVGPYRWDFALYGLNVLVDDVVRNPGGYGFVSRAEAAARLDTFLDFDALMHRDHARVFRDGRVTLGVYDGVRIDEAGATLRDVDFVWSKDVFEHLGDPRGFVPRIARVMSPDGVLYVDVDFKDHDHRSPGKDEWTFLERAVEHSSLNRLRAHEMVDDLIGRHYEILERRDEVRPIPIGRKARLVAPFNRMTDAQLSITGSILVCRLRRTGEESRQ